MKVVIILSVQKLDDDIIIMITTTTLQLGFILFSAQLLMFTTLDNTNIPCPMSHQVVSVATSSSELGLCSYKPNLFPLKEGLPFASTVDEEVFAGQCVTYS